MFYYVHMITSVHARPCPLKHNSKQAITKRRHSGVDQRRTEQFGNQNRSLGLADISRNSSHSMIYIYDLFWSFVLVWPECGHEADLQGTRQYA